MTARKTTAKTPDDDPALPDDDPAPPEEPLPPVEEASPVGDPPVRTEQREDPNVYPDPESPYRAP